MSQGYDIETLKRLGEQIMNMVLDAMLNYAVNTDGRIPTEAELKAFGVIQQFHGDPIRRAFLWKGVMVFEVVDIVPDLLGGTGMLTVRARHHKLAKQTMNKEEKEKLELAHTALVANLKKSGAAILQSLDAKKADVMHMAYCIPVEASELADGIKKHLFYEKEYTPEMRENVVEELGDLEFYMRGLRNILGITREETLEHNLKKLGVRYGEGKFTNEQAQTRADKAGEDSAGNDQLNLGV